MKKVAVFLGPVDINEKNCCDVRGLHRNSKHDGRTHCGFDRFQSSHKLYIGESVVNRHYIASLLRPKYQTKFLNQSVCDQNFGALTYDENLICVLLSR